MPGQAPTPAPIGHLPDFTRYISPVKIKGAMEKKRQWSVREALASDLPQCQGLDHAYETDYVWQMEFHEENGRISIAFRTARLPRTMRVVYPRGPDTLEAVWERHDCFLVAEDDGRILGYLTMREIISRSTAWVEDLVVGSEWRRRGVGSALLAAAERWAYERGLQRITLETQTKNYPAICFCQKHGMVFCGYNDRYYPNQDIAVFFCRELR